VLLLYTHRKCYLRCAEGVNSIVHARRKYYLRCAGAGNSLPYTHIESITWGAHENVSPLVMYTHQTFVLRCTGEDTFSCHIHK